MTQAADDFATIAQRAREIAAETQNEIQAATCRRCAGIGWIYYAAASIYCSCPSCGNPDNLPQPD